MAEELKLSNELLEDLRQALAAHDDRASDDLILVQYLSACNGFVLGQQTMDLSEKEAINSQLNEFTVHVMRDTDQQMRASRPEPAQEAFGIWRPGQG